MNTLNERTQAETDLVAQIEALEPTVVWTPNYDLIVNNRDVRLSVDLPGVLLRNLGVAIHDGRLFVHGHRLPDYAAKAVEHTSTRRTGRFALRVEIPAWVDPKRAVQVFEGGILTVVFPRRRDSRPNAHSSQ